MLDRMIRAAGRRAVAWSGAAAADAQAGAQVASAPGADGSAVSGARAVFGAGAVSGAGEASWADAVGSAVPEVSGAEAVPDTVTEGTAAGTPTRVPLVLPETVRLVAAAGLLPVTDVRRTAQSLAAWRDHRLSGELVTLVDTDAPRVFRAQAGLWDTTGLPASRPVAELYWRTAGQTETDDADDADEIDEPDEDGQRADARRTGEVMGVAATRRAEGSRVGAEHVAASGKDGHPEVARDAPNAEAHSRRGRHDRGDEDSLRLRRSPGHDLHALAMPRGTAVTDDGHGAGPRKDADARTPTTGHTRMTDASGETLPRAGVPVRVPGEVDVTPSEGMGAGQASPAPAALPRVTGRTASRAQDAKTAAGDARAAANKPMPGDSAEPAPYPDAPAAPSGARGAHADESAAVPARAEAPPPSSASPNLMGSAAHTAETAVRAPGERRGTHSGEASGDPAAPVASPPAAGTSAAASTALDLKGVMRIGKTGNVPQSGSDVSFPAGSPAAEPGHQRRGVRDQKGEEATERPGAPTVSLPLTGARDAVPDENAAGNEQAPRPTWETTPLPDTAELSRTHRDGSRPARTLPGARQNLAPQSEPSAWSASDETVEQTVAVRFPVDDEHADAACAGEAADTPSTHVVGQSTPAAERHVTALEDTADRRTGQAAALPRRRSADTGNSSAPKQRAAEPTAEPGTPHRRQLRPSARVAASPAVGTPAQDGPTMVPGPVRAGQRRSKKTDNAASDGLARDTAIPGDPATPAESNDVPLDIPVTGKAAHTRPGAQSTTSAGTAQPSTHDSSRTTALPSSGVSLTGPTNESAAHRHAEAVNIATPAPDQADPAPHPTPGRLRTHPFRGGNAPLAGLAAEPTTPSPPGTQNTTTPDTATLTATAQHPAPGPPRASSLQGNSLPLIGAVSGEVTHTRIGARSTTTSAVFTPADTTQHPAHDPLPTAPAKADAMSPAVPATDSATHPRSSAQDTTASDTPDSVDTAQRPARSRHGSTPVRGDSTAPIDPPAEGTAHPRHGVQGTTALDTRLGAQKTNPTITPAPADAAQRPAHTGFRATHISHSGVTTDGSGSAQGSRMGSPRRNAQSPGTSSGAVAAAEPTANGSPTAVPTNVSPPYAPRDDRDMSLGAPLTSPDTRTDRLPGSLPRTSTSGDEADTLHMPLHARTMLRSPEQLPLPERKGVHSPQGNGPDVSHGPESPLPAPRTSAIPAQGAETTYPSTATDGLPAGETAELHDDATARDDRPCESAAGGPATAVPGQAGSGAARNVRPDDHPTPPAGGETGGVTTAPAAGRAMPLQARRTTDPAPEHLPLAAQPGHHSRPERDEATPPAFPVGEQAQAGTAGLRKNTASPAIRAERDAADGTSANPTPAAPARAHRPGQAPIVSCDRTSTRIGETHAPSRPGGHVRLERDRAVPAVEGNRAVADSSQRPAAAVPAEPNPTGTAGHLTAPAPHATGPVDAGKHLVVPVSRTSHDRSRTDAGQRPTLPARHEHDPSSCEQPLAFPAPQPHTAHTVGSAEAPEAPDPASGEHGHLPDRGTDDDAPTADAPAPASDTGSGASPYTRSSPRRIARLVMRKALSRSPGPSPLVSRRRGIPDLAATGTDPAARPEQALPQIASGQPVFRRIAAHAPEPHGQDVDVPGTVLPGMTDTTAPPAADWGIPQAVLHQDNKGNGGVGHAR